MPRQARTDFKSQDQIPKVARFIRPQGLYIQPSIEPSEERHVNVLCLGVTHQEGIELDRRYAPDVLCAYTPTSQRGVRGQTFTLAWLRITPYNWHCNASMQGSTRWRRGSESNLHSWHPQEERFDAGGEKRNLTTIVGQDYPTIDLTATCVASRPNTKSEDPTSAKRS